MIVSDFFTESDWKKAVDFLCYKKRQVLLVQVLAPEERDPSYSGRVNLIDSESADALDERNMKINATRGMQLAYAEALKDYLADMRSFCPTEICRSGAESRSKIRYASFRATSTAS